MAHKPSHIIEGGDPMRRSRDVVVPNVVRGLKRAIVLWPTVAGFISLFTPMIFGRGPIWLIGGVAAVLMIIIVYTCQRWRMWRFIRQVRANNCDICTECGYVLRGLPSEHTCPECGISYRIENVRRVWMEFFATDETFVVR